MPSHHRPRRTRIAATSLALCERLGDDVGVATARNDLGALAPWRR